MTDVCAMFTVFLVEYLNVNVNHLDTTRLCSRMVGIIFFLQKNIALHSCAVVGNKV